MKNLLLVIAIFLVSSVCLAQFKLNTDPENPNRLPDPKTEIGVVLAKNSPNVTIGSGSGKHSTNFLPAGVLVIVDKYTHVAKWVAICGNTIITPNWTPVGKIISFTEDSYKFACEDMLDRLSNIENQISNNSHSLMEMRAMLGQIVKNTTIPKKVHSSWNGAKIISPLLLGAAGGLIGGYGFPVKTSEVIVTPGSQWQTGDGTIIFGPDHIKTIKHEKFNVPMAITGAVSGAALGFLLNSVIF